MSLKHPGPAEHAQMLLNLRIGQSRYSSKRLLVEVVRRSLLKIEDR